MLIYNNSTVKASVYMHKISHYCYAVTQTHLVQGTCNALPSLLKADLVVIWYHGICKSHINYSIAYPKLWNKCIVHSTWLPLFSLNQVRTLICWSPDVFTARIYSWTTNRDYRLQRCATTMKNLWIYQIITMQSRFILRSL